MEILELVKPSPWIESEDREWAFKIQSIINQLEQCFNEALVSLILFDKEMVKIKDSDYVQKMFFQDRERSLAIRKTIERDFDLTVFDNYEKLNKKVESILNQEKINQGLFPRSMELAIPSIYTKSFIYSLDTIDKLIKALVNLPPVPEAIPKISGMMRESFPDLIHVRDSSHHIEDRVLGLHGQHKKTKIELKPIDDDGIRADGGAIVLNNIANSSFGSTLRDGRYGKVDVSWESLEVVRGIIQSVIDSFQWKIFARHHSHS